MLTEGRHSIISLLPSATEILFALGLGNRVVGVSHECDYPPTARDKQVLVRSAFDPNVLTAAEIDNVVSDLVRRGESIYVVDDLAVKQLQPELIVTQTLCDVCAVATDHVDEIVGLLDQRPDVLSLHPHTLDDVLEDIRRVGEATGTDERAANMINDCRTRIDAVRRVADTVEARPKVLCLEWYEPLYIGGHWVPQMVELAGGEALLSKSGELSTRFDWQAAVDSEPDVIVLMPCGYDLERTLKEVSAATSLPGWETLPAVKEGRVYAVSGTDYFNRPGPRLIDGLELLAWILHPNLFSQPNLPAAVARVT